jgi:hypothetical protein
LRQVAEGVVSRRRGKASKRRLGESIRCRILARVRERYRDFGPTLAVACLREEGFRIAEETLCGWPIEGGL